ncbi:MAG: STM4012 family radical SAM protein [Alphaproteobacteria bacterium]|nr:STM4012 family radical SAM protein [Alphaproteobacteria bacterium]
MSTADALFGGQPYQGYAYSYPHKTAYRAFEPDLDLREVWAGEDRSALFLYAHVPFCVQRCAFCNLFTTAQGGREREEAYLQGLVRQAEVVREALPDARFAVGAVGGGTPTWLEAPGLDRLFDVLEHTMGAPLADLPLSVECSPETVTPEKADLLARRGTTRASIGIQSFVEQEARGVGRTQRDMTVQTALQALRDAGIPTLNIDLIYGLRHQTPASWQHSLECTLEWRPEEIYLYPLYVRPLTGLGRRDRTWDDQRLALYRQGRDLLRSVGYEQVSMRMFRAPWAPVAPTDYRCQADGMVGLGPGARSYTRDVHYSTRFAVGPSAVLDELDGWLDRSDADHLRIRWGTRIDADEARRRHVLQGLLQIDGLDRAWYRELFGADVLDHLPELERLGDLATFGDRLTLTDEGLAWSDAIGPWLYSDAVTARMAEWEQR